MTHHGPMTVYPTYNPVIKIGEGPGDIVNTALSAINHAVTNIPADQHPSFNQGDPGTAAAANMAVASSPDTSRSGVVDALDEMHRQEILGRLPQGTTQTTAQAVTAVSSYGGLALPSGQAAGLAATIPGMESNPHPSIPGWSIVTWAESWIHSLLKLLHLAS